MLYWEISQEGFRTVWTKYFYLVQLITYDALGLCKPGEAHKLVETGDNTYGGKYVINPSGGLISKGHPLGATGLAQCTELVCYPTQL